MTRYTWRELRADQRYWGVLPSWWARVRRRLRYGRPPEVRPAFEELRAADDLVTRELMDAVYPERVWARKRERELRRAAYRARVAGGGLP